MPESLQEFIDSRGLSLRVDRDAGIIRGVKILGLESQNGRSYLPEALSAAAPLYEGAKVNVNHQKGMPGAARDYQDRIGSIRNVIVRGAEGLFADFHFNPQHALAGQLAWDAEHAPENVGFSHNVLARTARRGERIVVENISKVQSVDLVADPATTRGLYEASPAGNASAAAAAADASLNGVWEQLTVVDIERHRPDLVAALADRVVQENILLRRELDTLRAAEAAAEKRALAQQLLAEARLPDPADTAEWAKAIVSESFFESLLLAPDESSMRKLVGERAQLVSAAAGLPARRFGGGGRPLARDQQLVESGWPFEIDAAAFARAIT